MKRIWATLAVAGLALGVLTGCNDYNNSVQYATGSTLVNIAPTGVVFGGPSFTLTITASAANGFPTNTTVQWNGQNLTTTFLTNTAVTAVVPASLIAKAGTAYVNTHYPQSGTGMNGLSNSLAFLIYGAPNPQPTLTSISPTTASACGTNCSKASLTITVTGTNFLPASTNGGTLVTIADLLTPNGQPTAINVTSYSSTELKALIPGMYLANADTAQIAVINPPSGVCIVHCPNLGGGTAGPLPLVIGSGPGSTATSSPTSEETPAISADGRYVAYTGQQNDVTQILLRDTCVGAPSACIPSTQTVSAGRDGTAGNEDSHTPVISADGRYVAFSSAATNLVIGAPAGRQIYLRDTCTGATCKPVTSLISTDSAGALTGTEAILPSISSSGRFVAFVAVTPSQESQTSPAKAQPALAVTAPNSGLRQVFLRDTCLDTPNCTPKTTRISVQPGDAPADSSKPGGPALSGLAKQIALAGGKSATALTKTLSIDEGVFLAITGEPQ
jgi:hypothetical protein